MFLIINLKTRVSEQQMSHFCVIMTMVCVCLREGCAQMVNLWNFTQRWEEVSTGLTFLVFFYIETVGEADILFPLSICSSTLCIFLGKINGVISTPQFCWLLRVILRKGVRKQHENWLCVESRAEKGKRLFLSLCRRKRKKERKKRRE